MEKYVIIPVKEEGIVGYYPHEVKRYVPDDGGEFVGLEEAWFHPSRIFDRQELERRLYKVGEAWTVRRHHVITSWAMNKERFADEAIKILMGEE